MLNNFTENFFNEPFIFDIKYQNLNLDQDYEDYYNASQEAFGDAISKDQANTDIKKILLDNSLLGYITFCECDDNDLGLSNFIILPEYRNTNLGTVILTDILNTNRDRYDSIFCFVNMFNDGAIRFYNRFGKVIPIKTTKGEYLVLFSDRFNKYRQNITETIHNRLEEEITAYKKLLEKEDHGIMYNSFLDGCKARNINFTIENDDTLVFSNYRDLLKCIQLLFDMQIDYYQDKRIIKVDPSYLKEPVEEKIKKEALLAEKFNPTQINKETIFSDLEAFAKANTTGYWLSCYLGDDFKGYTGPMFLLPNGHLIMAQLYVKDYDDITCTHGDFIQQFVTYLYSDKDHLADLVDGDYIHDVFEYLKKLGLITLNGGKGGEFDSDPRSKIVCHARPTLAQQQKLVYWLDDAKLHKSKIYVWCDKAEQTYDYEELRKTETDASQYMVRRILGYYAFGHLDESIPEDITEDYKVIYDTIMVFISDKTRGSGWNQELNVINHSISDTIKACKKQIGYKYNIEYLGPGKTHSAAIKQEKPKAQQLSLDFDGIDSSNQSFNDSKKDDKKFDVISPFDYLDETMTEEISITKANCPDILYHATFKSYLPSIYKYGLGNTNRTNSKDSKKNVVSLAKDKDVAIGYAEVVQEETYNLNIVNDDIVVLKIDTNSLNLNNLTAVEETAGTDHQTFEYNGIIPMDRAVTVLTEATRTQLIAKSRAAGAYKDQSKGKNRFERKRLSKIANQVKSYNQIDMNNLFKKDELQVSIPVVGETNTYDVTMRFEGVIKEIAKNLKSNNNVFEYKCVFQALTKMFNTSNVFVKCNCKDFLYNFDHWSIVDGFGVDDTAHDPGPGRGIRNPNNDKGTGCKHILLVLANVDWLVKVASVVNNYINYAAQNMKQAFLKIIFPKLYGVTADAADEVDLIPDDIKLETEKNIVDTINDWAKNRGKYQKGSNKNPVTGTGGRTKKPVETETDTADEDKETD